LRAYDYYVAGQHLLDQVENPRGADLAAENFRQALRIDPEFALAHVGLSEALWRVYYRDQDEAALQEAVGAAEEAVRIDPNSPEAQVALARGYRSTGRSAQSIEELSAVLARLPKPDEALRELASSYEAVGELDQAEQALRASTALAPDSWVNWNSLGMTLAAHGKYPEAREAFERATELAPRETSLPFENLATVDLAEGRIDDAIDAYEGIPRPIRNGRLASNIGTAYFFSDRADKWAKVEEYYVLAVRLAPRDAINRANLGDLYGQLGRVDEAVENYRMARDLTGDEVTRQPQDIELLSRLSLYSAKAGDCTEALDHTPALELGDQDTARLAHRRAYIYALCDRPEEAIVALRKAISLGESAEIIGQEPEFETLTELPEFQALTGI
jgi:tetratricopeptide (TPR) repeat protein